MNKRDAGQSNDDIYYTGTDAAVVIGRVSGLADLTLWLKIHSVDLYTPKPRQHPKPQILHVPKSQQISAADMQGLLGLGFKQSL